MAPKFGYQQARPETPKPLINNVFWALRGPFSGLQKMFSAVVSGIAAPS
jgi:hypothetical protein